MCNLIIPGEPQELSLTTPSGSWVLEKEPEYATSKQKIEEGQIAETYSLSIDVTIGSAGRSATLDAAFDELVPICLAASYLTTASVAVTRSLPHSECMIMEVGPHFPRPRAMRGIDAVTITSAEFQQRVEAFVGNHSSTGLVEKDRLLVHHWLDAQACWSMEDLCLSTATLLEIIAATARSEAKAAGQDLKTFNQRIQYASTRFSLPNLSDDFRNMRNDLVHEGRLSATKFPNKVELDCSTAAAEALEWIDQYMHAALGLGPVVKNRFPANTYRGLNAFSLH
ncbi:hypothetical protein EGJ09_25590 [Pseudomonas sp. p106]|nr:hypothetical protein EGJ09_25590 [Pseudomonas sp. p106]